MSKPAFQLSRVSGQPVSSAELLADLRRVAQLLGTAGVPQPQYRQHGHYDDTTVGRRFGSWNKALLEAGLSLCNEVDIPDERLFENLLVLWQHYGRQPRRSELAREPSSISQSPYKRRFHGWTAALKAFVDYANSAEIESPVAAATALLPPPLARLPYDPKAESGSCCYRTPKRFAHFHRRWSAVGHMMPPLRG